MTIVVPYHTTYAFRYDEVAEFLDTEMRNNILDPEWYKAKVSIDPDNKQEGFTRTEVTLCNWYGHCLLHRALVQ